MDINQIELAKHIAAKFHAGQKYGDYAYTEHVSQVAIKVKRAFPGDERLEVIAWLHDILEDTVCTYEMLLALFGDEVADAVKAMTKREDESRDDYIFLRVKPHPLARKVKLCDAFCNLHESLMRNDERRIKRYGETLGKLAIA